ncbi:MAG: hypothetical protein GKR89_30050 [Candidatus Latescibacteria bacterium]|nr:hypothetical protein [Candidatus Latescibacterota bacterium]
MTTSCAIVLSLSLLCYLSAALLLQGDFILRRHTWSRWGRLILTGGGAINALGVLIHLLVSQQPPFSHMLVVASIFIVVMLGVGLFIESYFHIRHLSLLQAPLAFLGLLYAVLMPVRLPEAESILLRYPWLGVHVAISMLGLVGFALSCATAIIYLLQMKLLKQGRLDRFLPALDTTAQATYYLAAGGFSFFSVGLGMGVIWYFDLTEARPEADDLKIWLSLPTWILYGTYLYMRGITGRHSSRLKWLVIAGFLLALVNLFGVRHHFGLAASVLP